jgi:hypothetical protein
MGDALSILSIDARVAKSPPHRCTCLFAIRLLDKTCWSCSQDILYRDVVGFRGKVQ